MKNSIAISLGILLVLLSSPVAAGDAYQRTGTEREKHAQAIFTGVFGQCRDEVGHEANGVVALVFSIGKSGKFGATSTLKEDEGKAVLQSLARCMGERANQARPFPKSDEKTIVGVKHRVESNGKLLMLGVGEAETLTDGAVFSWARKDPAGGGDS